MDYKLVAQPTFLLQQLLHQALVIIHNKLHSSPGSPATVEIRGDLVDSEDTDNIAAGTVTAVQALLIGGTSANNAIPQVSLGTLDVPTANTLG
jgi:hypothetical protein